MNELRDSGMTYMRASERTIRAGSVSLATKLWPAENGPRIVLVHGHGTNLETWRLLIDELVGLGSVIAFDRRGHGRSSDAHSYAAADLTNDIAAVSDFYGVTDPIVVGHSTGAWDGLGYATRSSARAVICLDQAIASDDPVWAGRLVQLDDHTGPEPGYTDAEWAARLAAGEAAVGEQLWRTVYGPMNERGLVRGSDRLLRYRPDLTMLRRVQADWMSFVETGEPYDRIACPVSIVLARHNTGPVHDALRRLGERRHLRVHEADSGHDIHVQQPQLVARLVRDNATDSHRNGQ